ncbi:hypothetical protein MMC24_006627 [Lignoscripta atroalba]|nr:hypothetical protein [Lignoscripta atroalba]
MSRRGYNSSEYYDERDRDYYPPTNGRGSGGSRVVDYEEVDIRERTRREPDFLREDYGRPAAGQLVVREREDSEYRGSRSERPKDREVEREEIIIARSGRDKPRVRDREVEREELAYRPRQREKLVEREVEREEVIYRQRERSSPPPPPAPAPIAREREEFIYRARERSPPQIAREREEWVFRPRPKEREPSIEREEITIRDRRERPREREPSIETEQITIRDRRERLRQREPSIEREAITIRDTRERERERPRDRGYEKDEIIIRRDERSRERPRPRESSFERDALVIRREERERPRERERVNNFREEDIVIRRDDRDGPRDRDFNKEEIIIRRSERELDPEPELEPEPEPVRLPEPIRAPPIHQEIITHHRHIDHGFENLAPAPIPAPPPRLRTPPRPRSPSPRSSFEEIEIRRRGERNGQHYDDDIFIERDSSRRKARDERPARRRSISNIRSTRGGYSTRDEQDVAEEADYYSRRVSERAYLGEAYNGAVKDWAIVDVPPGTKRVQMEGIGGANQEVTWQRYNGVRRSKFNADEDIYSGEIEEPRGLDRGRRFVGVKPKTETMWTEITKDLVVKEAIDGMGYDYEETEFFYYVMEYLRYEDVLRLVEISEDLRQNRRDRIREMERERLAERKKPQLALPWDEERVFEREVIYERPPPPPPMPEERIFEREIIYDPRPPPSRRYR